MVNLRGDLTGDCLLIAISRRRARCLIRFGSGVAFRFLAHQFDLRLIPKILYIDVDRILFLFLGYGPNNSSRLQRWFRRERFQWPDKSRIPEVRQLRHCNYSLDEEDRLQLLDAGRALVDAYDSSVIF